MTKNPDDIFTITCLSVHTLILKGFMECEMMDEKIELIQTQYKFI